MRRRLLKRALPIGKFIFNAGESGKMQLNKRQRGKLLKAR
jgi:hypothetical protein